ncbi:hypothetical protein Droror1_Dr00003504 [Drosera rotundifolia]
METNAPPEKSTSCEDQSCVDGTSNHPGERSYSPQSDHEHLSIEVSESPSKRDSIDHGKYDVNNDAVFDNVKDLSLKAVDSDPGNDEPHKVEDVEGKESAHVDGHHDLHDQPSFEGVSEEIERIMSDLSSMTDKSNALEIPDAVDVFVKMVKTKVERYNSGSMAFGREPSQDMTFIDSVGRISKLANLLGALPQESRTADSLSKISMVLQQAMTIMEEELRVLLDDSMWIPSKESGQNPTTDSEAKSTELEDFPAIPDDIVCRMNRIASAMISAGFETECCQVYSVMRRDAFKEAVHREGFEKISAEEIQKMQWEPLEGHIMTWVKVVKYSTKVLFPREKKLCASVFSNHPSIGQGISINLARAVIILFLNFAEAIAMTKHSAERLFKLLDIYETLTELISVFDDSFYSKECAIEIRGEISTVRHRLGEAAVGIFSDLENSIRSDVARNPVPSGAVHPLTRYTMNYLRYACDFKDALEQVFSHHQKPDQSNEYLEPQSDKEIPDRNNNDNEKSNQAEKATSFAAQLMSVMNLLDANLEAKSRLYKDASLGYIFLMNNGRYILQKIKESTEMHALVGDSWRRKRSSELRTFHKNYQRETWSKVLQCLRHEGLQVNGKVHKPILKERFKSFNQLFDDIHKTQSTWVVSDEQLQSELRVSISAVMIPAYRSFVARFGQHFTPGRQAEKYIKYQPEDIETVIEELFEGNPTSMARRKN